jgi:hypothetical protein
MIHFSIMNVISSWKGSNVQGGHLIKQLAMQVNYANSHQYVSGIIYVMQKKIQLVMRRLLTYSINVNGSSINTTEI